MEDMSRPLPPPLNSPHNSSLEPDTQLKRYKKRKKNDVKRTNGSTSSTTSSSSSSDETYIQQEKKNRTKRRADKANKDSPSALQHEIPKEENSIKYKSDGSEYRATTKAESDQLKDAEPIENESKGDSSPPAPSSDRETSSSPTKKSSDGSPKEPKSTGGQSTYPDSTTPAAPPSPAQPTIAITVFHETAKNHVRVRSKAGAGRRMPRPRHRAPARRRISRATRPAPETEPPEQPATTEPPKEPATTEPAVPEAKTESEETDKKREKKLVHICKRESWRARKVKHDVDSEEWFLKLPARGVVFITNTETDECKTMDHCEREVRKIQNHHMDNLGLKDIAYNWVVGGDRTIYEGLGWDCRSPLAKNKTFNRMIGHYIYIGFLGRYNPQDLPKGTLNYALAFIYLNMPYKHIKEDYKTHVYEKLPIIDYQKYDILPYM